MKIYFHLSLYGFSNSYVVVNESTKTALIIDPGTINNEMIKQIENENFRLLAILITHNHKDQTEGLETLKRIYDVPVIAADSEIAGNQAINGDGTFFLGNLEIKYFSVPGHSSDSIAYKIGNVIFVGGAMSAGTIGETTSSYAEKLLSQNCKAKILSHTDDTILMPAYGPPTTIGTEKIYNIELSTLNEKNPEKSKNSNE